MTKNNPSQLKIRLEKELEKIWARTAYRCTCCGAEKRIGETMKHSKECIYYEEIRPMVL